MAENKIGKLVKKAKGEDRSLREYSRDSGVDAAIISKIINGTYVPKKTDVYRALTSQEASPRGGVTYQQLVEAASSSKSYQAGLLAGMAATEAALLVTGGLPLAALGIGTVGMIAGMKSKKQKGDSNYSNNVLNEIQRFVATANGLLFTALASKGVMFHITGKNKDDYSENVFDTYLNISAHEISEYVFRYVYISKEYQNNKYVIENTSRRIIEELIFLNPSKKRKVSVVTNQEEAYEYMLSYKKKLSYNGELSIILVDVSDVKLLKEEYISHHVDMGEANEIHVV